MRDFLIFVRHLFLMLHFVRGVLLALLFVLLAFAAITAEVEGLSFADSLYFILITALTIGYGDITPSSGVTQVISILSGVVGVRSVSALWPAQVWSLRWRLHHRGKGPLWLRHPTHQGYLRE